MSATPKLKCTTNYDLFEPYEFNRDTRKDKHLIESMTEYGFDAGNPINCRENGNGKLKILQGHNRFETAKALGLPVWYVVGTAAVPVDMLERGVHPWTTRDFTVGFCRQGYEDYAVILDYHRATGIPLTCCMSMFGGQSAGSGNMNTLAKTGRFVIRNRELPAVVGDIVRHLQQCGVSWANRSRMARAICDFVMLPIFNVDRFKAKAKAHAYLFEKQASHDATMDMLESVYNRQAQASDRIPLAFLAKQASRARSASAAAAALRRR